MPDEPEFEPGPPREPIAHPDIDPDDVPAIVAFLLEAGGEETT
jgi:hypothetical protein